MHQRFSFGDLLERPASSFASQRSVPRSVYRHPRTVIHDRLLMADNGWTDARRLVPLAAGSPVSNEFRSGYFRSASEPNALSSMISTKPDAEKRFARPSLFASSERLKLA